MLSHSKKLKIIFYLEKNKVENKFGVTLSKGSPLPFEQKELKPVVARSLGFLIFKVT